MDRSSADARPSRNEDTPIRIVAGIRRTREKGREGGREGGREEGRMEAVAKAQDWALTSKVSESVNRELK